MRHMVLCRSDLLRSLCTILMSCVSLLMMLVCNFFFNTSKYPIAILLKQSSISLLKTKLLMSRVIYAGSYLIHSSFCVVTKFLSEVYAEALNVLRIISMTSPR